MVIKHVAWYETTRSMSKKITPSSHNRNQATTDEEQLALTYNDSALSFLYNEINNNKYRSTLNDLDLAHGLIDLLIESNFTLESLVKTSASELSKTLGIDQEVAVMICKVANKQIKDISKIKA
jgi:hypothetical protein